MALKHTLFVLAMCAYQVAAIRILGFVTVLGGDKDSDGCLESAGYTWCEDKNDCVHVTENCTNSLREM